VIAVEPALGRADAISPLGKILKFRLDFLTKKFQIMLDVRLLDFDFSEPWFRVVGRALRVLLWVVDEWVRRGTVFIQFSAVGNQVRDYRDLNTSLIEIRPVYFRVLD
jgi:hypothetical protein